MAPNNISDKGDSLVVQWLGLQAFTAKGMGSIPGRGTKILEAEQRSKKKKKKKIQMKSSHLASVYEAHAIVMTLSVFLPC